MVKSWRPDQNKPPRLMNQGEPWGGNTLGMSAAPTMLTSDMLSMLSTWTSIPTGRAEPTKGQTLSNISILHKSSFCRSGRDYAFVDPAVELWHKLHPTDEKRQRDDRCSIIPLKMPQPNHDTSGYPSQSHLTDSASCTPFLQTEMFNYTDLLDILINVWFIIVIGFGMSSFM